MRNERNKMLSHYACTWHALFRRILTRRWSTEVVRFDISVGVIDAETFLIAFQRSFKFVNCLPLQYILLLIMAHKFSMGFKSGLFGGHTITLSLLKPAFLSQSEVYFELCAGALSCWKIIVQSIETAVALPSKA